jgi:cyclopropane fatty-acyl-phospholipid synthase-like methyltransferase
MMFTHSMQVEFEYLSSASAYWGPAQAVGDFVRSLPEFPTMRKVLDLGGAAGFFSIAIVAGHPFMTGDVVERSLEARVITWECIRQYEMTARISVVKADFMTEASRNPYDLIVVIDPGKFFKHQWNEFLRKVSAALNPGGVFLTYQAGVVTTCTKCAICTKRATCAKCRKRPTSARRIDEWRSSELGGMDVVFPWSGITESMQDAGFQTITSVRL